MLAIRDEDHGHALVPFEDIHAMPAPILSEDDRRAQTRETVMALMLCKDGQKPLKIGDAKIYGVPVNPDHGIGKHDSPRDIEHFRATLKRENLARLEDRIWLPETLAHNHLTYDKIDVWS